MLDPNPQPVELVYTDSSILVCIKPAGVVSTDQPGGLPELLRQQLGDTGIRTVHRLDQVVSGLMVLARTPEAAGELSRQIRAQTFAKEYLAVIHGRPAQAQGKLRDLLLRNKGERKTYVVNQPGKGVQEAVLSYWVEACAGELSRVRIQLETGRTHQIRAQFSARGTPLVGDRKYGRPEDGCPIALWSCRLAFCHPATGKPMNFSREPPAVYPWTALSYPPIPFWRLHK